MNIEETFEYFYKNNAWGCVETKSGPGSKKSETFMHKYQFDVLFQLLKIHTICDVPCGDCNWIFDCLPSFIEYTGMDISKTAIEENITKFPNRKFMHGDIAEKVLPKYDLILCRDCMGHLPLEYIHKCLKNFKESGSKYLLTTTFINSYPSMNSNINFGNWMPINLQMPPFNFPPPLVLLNESIETKKLGLWILNDI